MRSTRRGKIGECPSVPCEALLFGVIRFLDLRRDPYPIQWRRTDVLTTSKEKGEHQDVCFSWFYVMVDRTVVFVEYWPTQLTFVKLVRVGCFDWPQCFPVGGTFESCEPSQSERASCHILQHDECAAEMDWLLAGVLKISVHLHRHQIRLHWNHFDGLLQVRARVTLMLFTEPHRASNESNRRSARFDNLGELSRCRELTQSAPLPEQMKNYEESRDCVKS